VGRLVAPARTLLGVSAATAGTMAHPRRALGLGREAADDAVALAQLLGAPTDPPSALKGHHGVAQRVAWTPPLALDDVKALAHATGTTVNDVLLAALAGALADDLRDNDRAAPPPCVHAVVPFDVRPPGAAVPAELGNRFGLVFAALPLGDTGPLERLASVHREMETIKRSRRPAVSYAALRVMGLAPATVEARLIDLFTAKGTAVVTDVPGPRRTVRLGGVALSDAFVWAPCAGSVGASVSIFSYRGAVRIGFLTHAGLSPTPARMAERIVAELRALRVAVAARPPADAQQRSPASSYSPSKTVR
jgi:diacylglycerol O-acyltransferase